MATDFEDQHLNASTDWNARFADCGLRLQLGKLLGHITQGAIGDHLSNNPARRGDAKEHLPTLAVQESTERLDALFQLARGFLEFQAFRFAASDQSPKLIQVHPNPPSPFGFVALLALSCQPHVL